MSAKVRVQVAAYAPKMTFLAGLLMMGFYVNLNGQPMEGLELAASKIPAELLEYADAVVRLDELIFTVESPSKASKLVRKAVTILKPAGREYGKVEIGYDRFENLASLDGWLFDAQGKKIRKLKDSDKKDISAISDYIEFTDRRIASAELYYDVYPYTVLFEYKTNHNGLISWPSWYPEWYRLAVERSRFEVNVPTDMPIRFHVRGLEHQPQIQPTGGDRKALIWEEKNLPKWEPQPYGPSWSEQSPSIRTAPTNFEIAGYAGDMSSWESFGLWVGQLWKGRATLPPAAKSEVASICQPEQTPREKIEKLYQYLQSKTRYVSVQLGIGGWQPFDAAYVYQKGYGDCKALTNYMIALLQEVGISSYPAFVRAGRSAPDVISEFPSNQFNHVILFVPLANDTLWLECTSQTAPFAYLGTFTEDRNVLVTTPGGGQLIRTPRSQSTNNRQVRKATVIVNEYGDARADVRTLYTGNQQDRIRLDLAQTTPREREEWLHDEIDLPTFRVLSADFSALDKPPQMDISLQFNLDLQRFASRSGTRLFLRPNLMERWQKVPDEVKERTQPVDLAYAVVDIDTISYKMPQSYVVEAPFSTITIQTPFGSYHAETDFSYGVVRYVRRMEVIENWLPADQYGAYRKFIADVVKSDAAQMVFVRKN